MCGIAGIISLKENIYHLPTLIQSMTEKLKHRGPDDEGYLLASPDTRMAAFGNDTPKSSIQRHNLRPLAAAPANSFLAFGHRRLSIFETGPAGHQPMAYDEDRYHIVFNGEIYNFPELRAELAAMGHRFHTNSDTETLLAGYRQWGEQLPTHLDGAWAFVIWDTREEYIFGSRDRFGVKPLYYIEHPAYFAFASEIKALVDLPFCERKLNRGAAFEYLVRGVVENENIGLFKDIHELMPGNSMSLNLQTGVHKAWRHYTLGYKPTIDPFDEDKFQKYGRNIRRKLLNAVRMRLRSDVQVGACLSGGLDSASIVCLADKILKESDLDGSGSKRMKVFTLGFDNKRYDESRWAEEVVKVTNTEWIRVKPDFNELTSDLENLVYMQDVPFFSTSTYAQYKLMQAIGGTGIKVTLDGQGGDELFSGYASHFRVFMKGLLKTGEYGTFMANMATANNSFAGKGDVLRFLGKSIYMRIVNYYKGRAVTRNTHPEYRYLKQEFWDRYKKRITYDHPFILNTALHKEFTGPDMKALLRTADRNSMAFGVESRIPFAEDEDLIKYVFNIPSIFKIRNGQGKLLLRQAMGVTLPEKILYRRDKNGFSTPEAEWLKQLRDPVREYINNDIRDLIDTKSLQKDWNRLFSNATPGSTQRLWRLINFAVWRKVYKV